MSYSSQTLPVNLGSTKASWNAPHEQPTSERTTRQPQFKVRSSQFIKPDPEQGNEWRTYYSKLTKPTRQHSEQLQPGQSIIGKRKDRSSDASGKRVHNERRDSHQEECEHKTFQSTLKSKSVRPSDSISRDEGTGDSRKTTSINTIAPESLLVSDDSPLTEPKLDESMDSPKAPITEPDFKNPHIDESQVTDGAADNSTANTSGFGNPCSLDDPSQKTSTAVNPTFPETSIAVDESTASGGDTDETPYLSSGPSFHTPSTTNYEPSNDSGADEPDASGSRLMQKAMARRVSRKSHQPSRYSKYSHRQASARQAANESICNLPDLWREVEQAQVALQHDWKFLSEHTRPCYQHDLTAAGYAASSSSFPLSASVQSSIANLRRRIKDAEVATRSLDRTLDQLAHLQEFDDPSVGLEDLDGDDNENDGFANGQRVQEARNRRARKSQMSSDVSQQTISSQARQPPTLGSPARTTRNSAETSVHCELQFGKRGKKVDWDNTLQMRAKPLLEED